MNTTTSKITWLLTTLIIAFAAFMYGSYRTQEKDIQGNTAYGVASTSMYLLYMDSKPEELRHRLENDLTTFLQYAEKPPTFITKTEFLKSPFSQQTFLDKQFLQNYNQYLAKYAITHPNNNLGKDVIAYANENK